jgi:hypothetical protein
VGRKLALLLFVTIMVLLAANPLMAQPFEGVYRGTFSGDDQGEWAVWVQADDTVIGGSASAVTGLAATVFGDVDPVGNLGMTAGTVATGATFTGVIDGAGQVAGNWTNAAASGTFIGAIEGANPAVFAGDYDGTYTGDDLGVWAMTIFGDGTLQITADSLFGGTEFLDGMVGGAGTIVGASGTGAQAMVFVGEISPAGAVDGFWGSSFEGVEGTFTNQGAGGVADLVAGAAGGGGCFIDSALDML